MSFPRKVNFTSNFGHLPRQTVNWELAKVPSRAIVSPVCCVSPGDTEDGTV